MNLANNDNLVLKLPHNDHEHDHENDPYNASNACDDEGFCSCSSSCSCSNISLEIPEPKTYDWKQKLTPFSLSLIIALIAAIISIKYSSKYATTGVILLYIFSYLIASNKILLKVLKNLKFKLVFDENFLMSIASLGAIILGNFQEAIAVMLFYQMGTIIEEFGVFKSKKSITALLENQPSIAHVKMADKFTDINPKDVKIGEIIIIKSGEKVPLDGVLLSEKSRFDTSMLTGESIPKTIHKGEEVLSGMINQNELIEIEVSKLYNNSAISRILDLVQHTESNKSETEKFTKKFAKYYTPSVVFAAILIALIPPILANQNFGIWSYRALVFLVISCPCALVISVPLSYFGGIGNASKQGILIKGTQHLETLSELDTIVFDKTGTITKGNFKVTKIVPLNGFNKQQLFNILAQTEIYSSHPIASAITKSHKQSKLSSDSKFEINNFKELTALGIFALINNQEFIAGNDKILHKFQVEHHHNYCNLEGTIVHVALNKQYLGYVLIEDEIRDNSIKIMQDIRNLGIRKMILLSGDEKSIVNNIGNKLGFDQYYGKLMPEDKLTHFNRIKENRKNVAYIGDGINDVPVIANADVGFAMGGFGSDAAIEAADVVLMGNSISKVGDTIKIAKRTRVIIWQNILAIFIVKGLFLLLAALGMMPMWGAIFADVGMALIAIINSHRMLNFNPNSIEKI